MSSRSAYDTDVTTFSPAGRLHQVEYAMEAVKQGSASVGVRSNTHAVLVAVKRTASDLASYLEKIFQVDQHVGISVSGLIGDARVLSKFMHNECLNHRYVYSSNIQVQRLVQAVADKSQVYTQKNEKRPYGVGLLVVGYDKTGPHLFETCPSGNFFEYHAQALGARAQTAKTYLEKNFATFSEASQEELIKHALVALRGTLQSGELNENNVSIGVVGPSMTFKILGSDEVKSYTAAVEAEHKDDKKSEDESSSSEEAATSEESSSSEEAASMDESA